MPINTQSIAYRDGETELTGVLVSNDSRYQKRPGILVVHGGAGLDDHAKERARRIAELGFVVFACDMYGNGVSGDRERVIANLLQRSRRHPDRRLLDGEAVLLQRLDDVDVGDRAEQPAVDARLLRHLDGEALELLGDLARACELCLNPTAVSHGRPQ